MDSGNQYRLKLHEIILKLVEYIKEKLNKLHKQHRSDTGLLLVKTEDIGGANMDLKNKLKAMIEDEETGTDEYLALSELAMKQTNLSENTRLLIAETFMGIRADEAKHKQLLKFIYSMIEEED